MSVAALIVWIIAAVGGFYLLGTWIAKAGQKPGGSHLPPGVLFGHFGLAAAGLVLWIVYMITDVQALAWIALAAVVVIALLGFTMFARWLPTFQAGMRGRSKTPTAVSVAPGGGAAEPSSESHAAAGAGSPSLGVAHLAESHFPVPVVVAHGLLAVATLVLVLLTALAL